MWITRKITLTTWPDLTEGVLLSRDTLNRYQQIQDILLAAEQKKAQILAAAQQEAQRIVADAQAEAERQSAAAAAENETQFWQRAETLFTDWHTTREQQDTEMLTHAQQLLCAAFVHIFDTCNESDKTTALLRQLLQASARGQSATLWCHPSQHDDVTTWLRAHPHFDWALQQDETQDEQHLMLQTAQGELSVNWLQLRHKFLHTFQT